MKPKQSPSLFVLQIPKGRSLSMRQPHTTGRRYNEYGYLPKTANSGTRTSSSGAPGTVNPDVVINGHNGSSGDSVGSGGQHHSVQSDNARLGNAANPNRSDMPDTARRKSSEQVSVAVTISRCLGGG